MIVADVPTKRFVVVVKPLLIVFAVSTPIKPVVAVIKPIVAAVPTKRFVVVVKPLLILFAPSTPINPVVALITPTVDTPLTLLSPTTSKVDVGFVVPIPTEPETTLKNVVVSEISKLPTFRLSVNVPVVAVNIPIVAIPLIFTFPNTSSLDVGRVLPIPTKSLEALYTKSCDPCKNPLLFL